MGRGGIPKARESCRGSSHQATPNKLAQLLVYREMDSSNHRSSGILSGLQCYATRRILVRHHETASAKALADRWGIARPDQASNHWGLPRSRHPRMPHHFHTVPIVPHVYRDFPALPRYSCHFARHSLVVWDKVNPRPDTVTSNVSAFQGKAVASAVSNNTRESVMFCRAAATNPSALSTPAVDFGSHSARILSIREPVPQPTSAHVALTGTEIQARKSLGDFAADQHIARKGPPIPSSRWAGRPC
jgi:hypothetical protein